MSEAAEVLVEHENVRPRTRLKTQEAVNNSDGLFFATHHTAKILLSQIYAYLEPSSLPSVGKRLGGMAR
jgi:hypothetical protein